MTCLLLRPHPLTPEIFAPYGTVLGRPYSADVAGFSNAASDFWHQLYFDAGLDGVPEVLWVNYRNTERVVSELEVHWETQQAIVPLGQVGIIHVVAASDLENQKPDLHTIRAFYVQPGQGINMNPGCWHTTRVIDRESTCLMLTRGSTTIELAAHLRGKTHARETGFTKISAQIFMGSDEP